jgi:hypothetical protein
MSQEKLMEKSWQNLVDVVGVFEARLNQRGKIELSQQPLLMTILVVRLH